MDEPVALTAVDESRLRGHRVPQRGVPRADAPADGCRATWAFSGVTR